MITTDVRSLLGRAHPHVTRNLEGAAGFTIARTHYEVTLEHLFLKFLEDGKGDLPLVLRHFDVDAGAFQERLLAALEDLRAGNSGRPVFSPLLLDSLERAFLVGAVEYGQDQIRSGTLFASVPRRCAAPRRCAPTWTSSAPSRPTSCAATSPPSSPAPRRTARRPAASPPRDPAPPPPAGPGGPKPDSALAQFTLDFTAEARERQDRSHLRPRRRDPPGDRHPDPAAQEQPDPRRRGRRRQDRAGRGPRPAGRRRRRPRIAARRRDPRPRPRPPPGRRRRQGGVREPPEVGHRRDQGVARRRSSPSSTRRTP